MMLAMMLARWMMDDDDVGVQLYVLATRDGCE